MKKRFILFILLPILTIQLFMACTKPEKSITKIEFNEKNELEITYDDNTTDNFGYISRNGEDEQGLEFYRMFDGNYAVKGGIRATTLTKIVIPATFNNIPVTKIMDYAFYTEAETDGFDAREIIIPDSITYIGTAAFQRCNWLREIEIPDGVTEISNNTFIYCYNLSKVVLPDTLISIGKGAFGYCRALGNIDLPESLERIESGAFGWSGLRSIKIPDSVYFLGVGIFSTCESLSTVKLPDNILYVPTRCFYYCANLKSITIPDSVCRIGSDAFDSCTSLESIDMPSSLYYLADGVFRNCTSLTSVDIRGSIDILYHYTFYNCSSLKSITIPTRHLNYIEENALGNCTSLKTINFAGTLEKWKNISKSDFSPKSWKENVPEDCDVVCTDGTVKI